MRHSALGYPVCIAFLVGFGGDFGAVVCAADLASAEKQHLEAAKKDLKQFQTNLKLALDAAGPGEDRPPASKARLAQTRLESARQSAANVEARLGTLPAANEEVKSIQTEYDKAMQSMTALADRLAGKGTKPASGAPQQPAGKAPGKTAPPPAGEAPLGYQNENSLKIAQSNVDQVAAFADEIEKSISDTQKSGPTVDAARVIGERIKEARRRSGFAQDQFKKLPADHSRVKTAASELNAAVARIDAAEKALDPIAKQAMKAADPGADFKADNERLKEITSSLAIGNLQHDRARIAELARQLPDLKAEHARLQKKYAALLAQNTGDSDLLKRNGQQLDYRIEQFEKALEQEKKVLPQQIDADLERVTKLGEQAIAENKPAFFKGGIADTLRFAADRLVLYEALDPAGGKAAAQKLAAAREKVKQQEASLAESIIAGNDLPPDSYAGPDKADLITRATDAIKKQHPKAQVLAVRIPSSQWERETMWRYQNREWYRIDRSKLQASVIVKRDTKIAELRPVNLWKDHMAGDKINAFPLLEANEELSPQFLLLVTKVK